MAEKEKLKDKAASPQKLARTTRDDLNEKDRRILDNVLAAHPGLTEEEAIEQLLAAGL